MTRPTETCVRRGCGSRSAHHGTKLEAPAPTAGGGLGMTLHDMAKLDWIDEWLGSCVPLLQGSTRACGFLQDGTGARGRRRRGHSLAVAVASVDLAGRTRQRRHDARTRAGQQTDQDSRCSERDRCFSSLYSCWGFDLNQTGGRDHGTSAPANLS